MFHDNVDLIAMQWYVRRSPVITLQESGSHYWLWWGPSVGLWWNYQYCPVTHVTPCLPCSGREYPDSIIIFTLYTNFHTLLAKYFFSTVFELSEGIFFIERLYRNPTSISQLLNEFYSSHCKDALQFSFWFKRSLEDVNLDSSYIFLRIES